MTASYAKSVPGSTVLASNSSRSLDTAAKIEVKNLYKIFGDQPDAALQLAKDGVDKDSIFNQTGHTLAVKDVSLSIRSGEIFVVMGLSGSGKSTLIRLLNRLIEPTQGHVLLDGDDVVTMSDATLRQARRDKMSMVFQSFALMPHLSALENASFGLMLAGVGEATRKDRAMQALKQVGLDTYAHSYPDELSGGMQQRVGLARALANDPDILLMDEAFSALDPLIRTEMQNELLALQSKQRRTIVFISHDLDEAMRIGDRIAIMQGGEVVQVGTPEDILNNPANDYIRSFFKEVDVSQVLTAGDVAKPAAVIVTESSSTQHALQQLEDNQQHYGILTDANRRFVGVISTRLLHAAANEQRSIDEAIMPDMTPILSDVPIRDTYALVAKQNCAVPVVDTDRRYVGDLSQVTLLETLSRSEQH